MEKYHPHHVSMNLDVCIRGFKYTISQQAQNIVSALAQCWLSLAPNTEWMPTMTGEMKQCGTNWKGMKLDFKTRNLVLLIQSQFFLYKLIKSLEYCLVLFAAGRVQLYNVKKRTTQIWYQLNKELATPASPMISTLWPSSYHIKYFHPLEVVSRYRDPQLQMGENY